MQNNRNLKSEQNTQQQVSQESKAGIRMTVAALVILMVLIFSGFSWSVYREAQRLKAEPEQVVTETPVNESTK